MADISSNNPTFDPSAYASAGHLLIAIKATEGTGYVNPDWQRWVTSAHGCRLAVCHYHFCDGASPIAEAAHFWTVVRPHFKVGVDRLLIDFENPALARLGSTAGRWLTELDRETIRLSGIRPIGYTFASAISAALQLQSRTWIIAAWGTTQPSGAFRRIANGTLWGWQYTDGQVDPSGGPRSAAGIGQCDMSVISPPIVSMVRKARR